MMLDTALILAGGFGTRLRPVVSDVPKPMAKVAGEPFLNYQLRYLSGFGIRNVILSVGYMADTIIRHYGEKFGSIDISYSIEEQPLGTGGGIRKGLESVIAQNVLVLNGDSFFEIDLAQFGKFHSTYDADASLALRSVNNASRYGMVKLDESRNVLEFQEKQEHQASGLINAGVYILDRQKYLDNTPSDIPFSIEKEFFSKQIGKLRIKGFEYNGYFIDIGVPEDYAAAQNDFKGFRYQ